MSKSRTVLMLVAIASFGASFVLPAVAQTLEIKSTPVQLAENVPAVLYEPVTPTAKSQIAVFVMHEAADYRHFVPCTELSKRGYRVLCAKNSVGDSANKDGIDRKILDAKFGIEYLRKYPGVKKIVLLGHSGGGMLISAYQNIAENGLKACQGPEKILPCSDALAGLPPADGIMLLDVHFGDSMGNTLLAWNPAASADGKVNPDLDPYNPKNGYDPKGSKYTTDFLRRYEAEVGKRMNQTIQDAQAQLAADKSGEHANDLFNVPMGSPHASLQSLDPELLSHTHNAWPLLHADGTATTQVVHATLPPSGKSMLGGGGGNGPMPQGGRDNGPAGGPPQGPAGNGPMGGQGGGRMGGPGGPRFEMTTREFLNTYAIRTTSDFVIDEDSVHGIDWSSTYASAPANVKGIRAPLLTMGMTAGVFMATELIYNNAKSADKTIAYVEGATHMFSTCAQCEKYPGQYGDTVKTLFDYVDKWLSKDGRF